MGAGLRRRQRGRERLEQAGGGGDRSRVQAGDKCSCVVGAGEGLSAGACTRSIRKGKYSFRIGH